MTDSIVIRTGIGETWQCTGDVRWLKGEMANEIWRAPSRLQQRWICPEAGTEEWRDAPTVEG